MDNNRIKKINIISILIAFACILSYIDKTISGALFGFIPVIGPYLSGFKLGMANIVILFLLFKYGFKEGFIAVILKSIIIGFIYSGALNFIIGFTGSIFSFFAMYLLKNILKNKYIVFVSMVGGFIHMLFQILTIMILYNLYDYVVLYSPFLLMFGMLSGLVVGFVAKKVLSLIRIEE